MYERVYIYIYTLIEWINWRNPFYEITPISVYCTLSILKTCHEMMLSFR